MPTEPPSATEMKPTESEMRPPQMIRLKMSRPYVSVPQRWIQDGPASTLS